MLALGRVTGTFAVLAYWMGGRQSLCFQNVLSWVYPENLEFILRFAVLPGGGSKLDKISLSGDSVHSTK
jgi:hypothetical protein